MRPQIKIFFLIALVALIIAIFVIVSNLMSKAEDDIYLTPIPESTWSAYHRDEPINSKYDAVMVAAQEIHGWRLVFTQGEPQVVYAEKMKVDDVRKLLHIQYEKPGNTKVWLVIFKGQWQILPPMVDELEPVETGCIDVIVTINGGVSHMGAGECIQLP